MNFSLFSVCSMASISMPILLEFSLVNAKNISNGSIFLLLKKLSKFFEYLRFFLRLISFLNFSLLKHSSFISHNSYP